jgi:epoxyqueuosine reductase
MQSLSLPQGTKRLLLHTCCAPCVGSMMLELKAANIDYCLYFYNPNIHPRKEYLLRKEENLAFAKMHQIEFIDADYDTDNWFAKIKGYEQDPERGVRCTLCFDMRFLRTAQYASEHGFDVMTSSLGLSRWKNLAQINASGIRAASAFNDLTYWTHNFRKQGGSQRMLTVSKDNQFYMQQYCGCVYSLRDTNRWRQRNNRSKVELGNDFYGHTESS